MTRLIIAAAGLVGLAAAAVYGSIAKAEHAVPIPPPAHDVPAAGPRETAVLAGGCFWGMEAVFEHVKGVTSVTAGYDGGRRATANYAAVSTERTQQAEAVRIVFDPHVVSYGTLLRVYFSIAHDPTELNRQGPDTGPSYRSAIFPQTPAQKQVAVHYIRQLRQAHAFKRPIVTRIEAGTFYPAEAYHQHFYDRHPDNPYIVTWDKPKVVAFHAAFPRLWA